ncbi:MAG: nitrogenase iron protein NifH [Firmicutes bacterium]|nr:nitrogenase iron protein NifH [Bacillota bacterium]
MRRIAVYGKGGIGKSTICSNLAACLAADGHRVMQIGCDPKADSTMLLRRGSKLPTVLDTMRSKGDGFELEDVVYESESGVICIEAGGPVPGLGCAGRGIITALEKLEQKGLYDRYRPDVILYDVLGDVVCGGFSMPMRGGYADTVYIVTSGENMSIYAAANIAMAISNFKGRGYAALGGIILNRRDVRNEYDKVSELAAELETEIIADIPRSPLVQDAEEKCDTLIRFLPESEITEAFRGLSRRIIQTR